MEDLIAPVLLTLVMGGVAGYFVGTLIKRAAGMTMAIVVFAAILLVLAFAGDLNINIEAIYTNIRIRGCIQGTYNGVSGG